MADPGPAGAVVLSGTWGRPNDEAAFVMRAVAAALSRHGQVQVVVPGEPAGRRPDGAFDPAAIGGIGGPGHGERRWPDPAGVGWPAVGPAALAVVEGGDPGALALAELFLAGVPTFVVGPRASVADDGTLARLDVGPAGDGSVGCHVPVHQLAASRGHVGIGFDDYVLVLGGRHDANGSTPTSWSAWLAARFADRHVLVVQDAVTTVWRARSLRGVVTVDTRTDLWRLLSHARVTVDLAPGPLIARECVESLLYGVPIVVPAGTTAARLAASGGGLWFSDEAELIGCVEAMDEPKVRDTLGDQGRRAAFDRYGDADRFVERVGGALSHLGIQLL